MRDIKNWAKLTQCFEEFLQDTHAETYTGTDDLMPDDYERWLAEFDCDEWVYRAECYAAQEVRAALAHQHPEPLTEGK